MLPPQKPRLRDKYEAPLQPVVQVEDEQNNENKNDK